MTARMRSAFAFTAWNFTLRTLTAVESSALADLTVIQIAILAWVIPFIWATLFLFMGKPALMVFLGGLATVVILLIVVFAAVFFRYYRLDQRLLPTRLYDICLWISSISIVVVALYVGWDTLSKLMSW